MIVIVNRECGNAAVLQEDGTKCQLFHLQGCFFLQEAGEEAGRGIGICKEKLF